VVIPSSLEVAIPADSQGLVGDQERRIQIDRGGTQAVRDVEPQVIGLDERVVTDVWLRRAHGHNGGGNPAAEFGADVSEDAIGGLG